MGEFDLAAHAALMLMRRGGVGVAQNGTRVPASQRAKRELAASLLAEDRLTDAEIAARAGISRSTLARWKRSTQFQQRIAHHQAAQADSIVATGIASRRARIEALNDRWQRLQRIIAERAEVFGDRGPDGKPLVPGGGTGLLMHFAKSGEFVLDAALLRELRAVEEQAARELGQWVDRSRLDLAFAEEIERVAATFGVSPDDVRRDLRRLLEGQT